MTYLGSKVTVNFFHAWYANYGIQSAIDHFLFRPLEAAEMRHSVCPVPIRFWLVQQRSTGVPTVSPGDPSEPWGNQLDTMTQFLPVRGVGAKFVWGEFGHHRVQRLLKQIRSWTFIPNRLNCFGKLFRDFLPFLLI